MAKKSTILIVDDEENIVRSLNRALRDQFNVLTATSGEAALDILAREEVAVVLTDQRMPGMTGVQLLDYTKRHYPNTVGILVSGYSDVNALVDALNVGVVRGYIHKPWDIEDLRSKLTEAVQQFDALFNRAAVEEGAAAAVAEARTQIAAFRKILDLITSEQMAALFAQAGGAAQGPPGPAAFNRGYLEHLTDGFGLIRANGEMDYWNPAGRRLLGLAEDSQGGMFCAAPHLAGSEGLCRAVRGALAGEPMHAEFFLTDPQGSESALEVAATPVPAAEGGCNAVLIIRDQTQRMQTLAHLKGLNEVTAASNQARSPEAHIKVTLAACQEATRSDGAFIYRRARPDAPLALAGVAGVAPEALAALAQQPVEGPAGAVGRVMAEGRPQTYERLSCCQLAQQEHAGAEVLSVALAPVRDPEGVSGVLGVFTRRLRRFTPDDLQLLSAIGSQFGAALHSNRLYHQLEHQARTDALTGIFNRRHFMALSEAAYQKAVRRGAPLTALMMDLVRFKQINDTYGHAAGDLALQAAAAALAAALRESDLLGRYGGDEFAALLLDCQAPEAQQVAQRLRANVQAVALSTPLGPVALDVSIGLAAARPEDGEGLDALLMRADAAMYAAKTQAGAGR